MVTKENVYDALRGVMDPELGRSLVDLGMVRDVKIAGSQVSITLALTTLACPLKDGIVNEAKRAVMAVSGVSDVSIALAQMTASERDEAFGKHGGNGKGKESPQAKDVNKIDKVVAVMSGKGGVGKSLVTGLLAVALAREGKKVGILDGDITGPSIPRMFGLRGQPQVSPLGLMPVRSRLGIGAMSINLLLDQEDQPVVWRGPVISGTIKQFWEDVLWGELDYLLVDLPPGTADAPLTVMQSLPLTGVVIVSTPQDLASMIVRKAVRMADMVKVPVLGVVENMSYFTCPDTGKQYEIFGPSHGEEMARAAHAPLLARLPIDPQVAALCDAGLIEQYDSEAYQGLAKAFVEAVATFETNGIGLK